MYVSLAIKACQKPHSVKETTGMQTEETDRESLEKGWVKCVCVCGVYARHAGNLERKDGRAEKEEVGRLKNTFTLFGTPAHKFTMA